MYYGNEWPFYRLQLLDSDKIKNIHGVKRVIVIKERCHFFIN